MEKIIKDEAEDISKEKDLSKGNLEKELEIMKSLAEERLNQFKYLQADFENYKKRLEKEKSQIVEMANYSLIKELLVVLDDLDAAVKSAEEKNKEGFLSLKKKFYEILVNRGLKEIESLGEKFNPEFHDSLCKELSEHEEDTVIDEIQKGYSFCSKVMRASKVKVSKGLKENKLDDKDSTGKLDKLEKEND